MSEPRSVRFFPYQAIVDRPPMRLAERRARGGLGHSQYRAFHSEIGNPAPDIAISPAATTATGSASGA